MSEIINQTQPNTKQITKKNKRLKTINLDIRENYLNVEVKLHNDMSNLNNVYIIESFNKKEFQKLKK